MEDLLQTILQLVICYIIVAHINFMPMNVNYQIVKAATGGVYLYNIFCCYALINEGTAQLLGLRMRVKRAVSMKTTHSNLLKQI